MFIKSPFNYIGNKYKLLAQIIPLLPKDIDNFYDIFCGALDVSINIKANKIFASDINHFLIQILTMFKNSDAKILIDEINLIIEKYALSKEDKESYYKFRDYYNENKSPLLLYVLMCFSFNYQFRFNNEHNYNNPAGTNRSSFNKTIENRVLDFIPKLENIDLNHQNFKDIDYSTLKKGDFLYADPPYSSSIGSYNDGKRGFEGWNEEDDLALFNILDNLNEREINFALSNVIFNNGKTNHALIDWSKKYKIHYLDYDYNNSNYQRKRGDASSEVLITNYKGD